MDWRAITAGEAFALAMLTVIAFSFGIVLTLLAVMLRGAVRRDREVERLLEEVRRDERRGATAARRGKPKPRRDNWEKDPDWWKSA